MVTPEILAYIREQLQAGLARDAISQALVGSGWKITDINEALAAVGAAVQPTQPLPPPVVPVTAVVTPAVGTAQTLTPEVHAAAASPVSQPPVVAAPAAKVFKIPVVPAETPQADSRHSHVGRTIVVIIIVLLLGIAGGSAYAYVEKIGPFANPPYAESNFSSGILAKIGGIQTSTYLASAALSVEPREADAKPFTIETPDQTALVAEYQRDSTRATDASFFLQQLKNAKAYPPSLSGLIKSGTTMFIGTLPTTTDPESRAPYNYTVTEGGKNFNLSVTFETKDAIAAIERAYGYTATSTLVSGETVTFTKASPTYFNVSSTPPKPLFVELQDMASYLPSQLAASFSVGATTDWTKKEQSDWKFNVDATGDFGDLTYKVDADALKKDGSYYFRINNIPSILGSLSSYKGIWVKVDSNAATSSGISSGDEVSFLASRLPDAEAAYKKQRAAATDLLIKASSIADEEGLVHFKTPPRTEKVDGRLLYRYDLAINEGAIVPFYTRIIAEAKKNPELSADTFLNDQGLLDYLKSQAFDSVFAYYDANTTITAWIDPAGFPAIVSYSLRFVPPDTALALKDKQARLTFTLSLSGINSPVTIDAPTDAKNIKDLAGLDPFSSARNKGSDAAIQSDLATIATQAEIYYAGTGKNSYGSPATSCTATSTLFADPTVARALTGAIEAANGGIVSCNSSKKAYAVQAKLNAPASTTAPYWCIDSTGAAKSSSSLLGSAVVCP